jgi:hypothetical protein
MNQSFELLTICEVFGHRQTENAGGENATLLVGARKAPVRTEPDPTRSFALPAPGLTAWPRLRAKILQNKLALMGFNHGNCHPERRALNGRHLDRPNNVKTVSN